MATGQESGGRGPDLLAADEVLHTSLRTRVVRVSAPGGSGTVVRKECLGADGVERAHHEATLLKRLQGIPGVPRLLARESDRVLVLADGGRRTLAQELAARRASPMPVADVLRLAADLADTIARVHQRGVVHRDLTPDNIVLDEAGGRPGLIDFDRAGTFADERATRGTSGALAGALPYLAPEQTGRTGQGVDHRTDLYSLGAILYELCTGEPPFGRDASDPLVLLHAHLAEMPEPAARRHPGVPAALSDLVDRLLEKDPGRRYQSAGGLLHDLRAIAAIDAGTAPAAEFHLGAKDFPLRLEAPSHLAGRDAELALLASVLADVAAGDLRGMLVAGPPGVGKSALVERLRPLTAAAHGWFLTGRFDQVTRGERGSAVIQVLHGLARMLLAEPEAFLARLRAELPDALGANAGLLAALVPEFGSLLGLDPEPLGGATENQGRIARAVVTTLRAIASPERPVVMVMENLQWAADFSLDLIEALLIETGLDGVLVVAVLRDDDPDLLARLLTRHERLVRLGLRSRELQLGNLDDDDLATLLRDLLRLGADESRRLAEAVAARTRGNPYETIELVNSLRADEVLVLGADGWTWDPEAIRHYVDQRDVGSRFSERIARLPAATVAAVDVLACLGGEADLGVLAAASDLRPEQVRDHLLPALESGMLILAPGADPGDAAVRFRHGRLRQQVLQRLDDVARQAWQLRIGRRLHQVPAWAGMAAEQYLGGCALIEQSSERRAVTELFARTAAGLRVTDPAAAERLLRAGHDLLEAVATNTDSALLRSLDVARHAALYSMGGTTDLTELYRSIADRCGDPLDLVDAACVQIAHLTDRARPAEAVALGLDLLGHLGVPVPPAPERPARIERGLADLAAWGAAGEGREPDGDELAHGAARVIQSLMPAAFFSDAEITSWLVMESRELWERHGPDRALVGPLAHAGVVLIGGRDDYRAGHDVVRRVLSVSERRGWTPETAHARFLFAVASAHWLEPLESGVAQAGRAREDLLQAGIPQVAAFTYHATVSGLLDLAPTLESYRTGLEACFALVARIGNDQTAEAATPYARLVDELCGSGDSGDSLDSLDSSHTLGSGWSGERDPDNLMATANEHLTRALAAAVLGDEQALLAHTEAAMPLLPYLQGHYATYRAHFLRALALAGAVRASAGPARAQLLAELDGCREWLRARATDAPANFAHLLHLVDAEKAWTTGDFRGAMAAFDAAMQSVDERRPWHEALVLERAAGFHLWHGHEHAARSLLAAACASYARWGAEAKVRQLRERHPFLREVEETANRGRPRAEVSAQSVDLLAVLRASQALSGETQLDALRVRVVEVLTAMTGATQVTVLLRDEDDQGWTVPGGDAGTGRPGGTSATELGHLTVVSALLYAERTGAPLVVADAAADDRFRADPYLLGVRCCSLLVLPIQVGGRLRVMLVLENRLHSDVFAAERLDAVMLIAGQLAVSFDNALARRLREREAERRQKLVELLGRRQQLSETLLAIQRRIARRAPLQEVLDSVTAGVSAMVGGGYAALVLVEAAGSEQPRMPSGCGSRPAGLDDAAVVALARAAIHADQLADSPDGALVAAAVHAEGTVIGSLVALVGEDDESEVRAERREVLAGFAEQVSLALNDANTLEAIRQASHDPLTGLPSRSLFLDRLRRTLATATGPEAEVTVLFVDLDRFKVVNDSLGHAAGDALLAQVADRIRACIRASDVAARLGGDEFALLLEQTTGLAVGLRVAEQIDRAMRTPFRIADRDVFVGASVGLARGRAGDDADDVLARADLAMYRAKKDSARSAVVYEPRMHSEVRERLELEGDFRRAVGTSQLRLQFQPLLDLAAGRPIGVEALLRWRHPQRGLIPPDVFVPMAEEIGAIFEVGAWVLKQSCRQAVEWRERGWADLRMSVNVSGHQLLHAEFAALVADVLANTGLPPAALTLELTETVVMDDPEAILPRLSQLKGLGVRLAIDDFGTGYSSLSYLRRFPVDDLKIDKSFVAGITVSDEERAIVSAILQLAGILNLRTTAEGVETHEQLDLLRSLGCQIGQGYLFSRPLDPGDVPSFLATPPAQDG